MKKKEEAKQAINASSADIASAPVQVNSNTSVAENYQDNYSTLKADKGEMFQRLHTFLRQSASATDAVEFDKVERLRHILEHNIIRRSSILPHKEFLCDLFGVPFFPRKSISVFKGKEKVGKSSVLQDIIKGFYCDNGITRSLIDKPINCIYYDLEQEDIDTQLVFKGVPESAEEHLFAINLRESDNQVKDFILFSEIAKPDIIVIDTIGDAVADYNDAETSRNMIIELLAWASKNDIRMIVNIHTNKADNNAQGAWGKQLEKKAHDWVLVELKEEDGTNGYQVITHQKGRRDGSGMARKFPKQRCYEDFKTGARTYYDDLVKALEDKDTKAGSKRK